jgi:hypothetical protein
MTDKLSSTYEDLRKTIGNYLGLSLDPDDWDDGDVERIEMIIKRGLRQFYFSPPLNPDELAYEWNFLKPIATLTTIDSYSEGTIEVSSGVCTLTDGVWPNWAATNGELTIGTTKYAITKRTDETHLEVVGDDVVAGTDYSLSHNGNYDLPDDFGGIEGPMTFDDTEHKPPIKVVGEGMIRDLRGGQTARSFPCCVAIRPKETDGTAEQGFEAMFFPIPDNIYTLYYRKIILPDMIDSQNDHPYGGIMHADTIEASCLAAAEFQEDGVQGPMYQNFLQRLAASIGKDKAMCPDYFGYNADNSDGAVNEKRSRSGTNLITYKGRI